MQLLFHSGTCLEMEVSFAWENRIGELMLLPNIIEVVPNSSEFQSNPSPGRADTVSVPL